MSKKTRIAIIFGGKSAEHEVSIQSAKNIVSALDKEKYEPVLIYIDKAGQWFLNNSPKNLLETAIQDSSNTLRKLQNKPIPFASTDSQTIDVVFPVLHGTYGEDGTVQGMLKLMDLPFVGCSVLSSAVGMDKDVMKRLLKAAKIPVAKFVVFRKNEAKNLTYQNVTAQLGSVFFVKPANAGSSIGVSKVKNINDFAQAITEAFKYDNKIIIEEFIKGREIEVSVLGNDEPIASVLGEVIPTHEFYSYEAKYLDENGAILKIPADLSKATIKKAQNIALRTYQTLCCEGLSRVDMFLTDTGKLYINEINTLPGFTKISMYPKLWDASGISYAKLLDKLIQLAIERFNTDKKLKVVR